jgi:nicotinamidase-related amidase
MVPRLQTFLAAARGAGVPVVHVVSRHDEQYASKSRSRWASSSSRCPTTSSGSGPSNRVMAPQPAVGRARCAHLRRVGDHKLPAPPTGFQPRAQTSSA